MLKPAIQDRTRWWNYEDLLLIVLLGVLLYFPGLGQIPLFDRDEPRFASAGRAMFETGDYIVPYFNEVRRPDKPPLIYWLQCGAEQVVNRLFPGAGFNELVARLPSAVCGILTLIVVYFAAGKRFGRVTGLVSALILGSSVVFVVESRLSTADSAMILFNTLAMACAWCAFESHPLPHRGIHTPAIPKVSSLDEGVSALDFGHLDPSEARPTPLWAALLFWIALGLGTLAKGVPIIFVPLALVTVSLFTGRLGTELRRHTADFFRKRNFLLAVAFLLPVLAILYTTRALVPLRGSISIVAVIVTLMIALPHLPSYLYRYGGRMGNWSWWKGLRPLIGVPLLLLITLPWFIAAWIATDGDLIRVMLSKHVAERALVGLEGHEGPPGFYLVTVWGTFWPWSILLIPMAYHVTRRLLGRTAVVIDPRPYQFLVCWIVPAWLVFEIAKTKLFHYTLPLFIPIAILSADTLVQSWLRLTEVLSTKWFNSAKWVWLGVWAGGGVAASVGCYYFIPPLFGWSLLFAGAMVAAGVASTIAWGRPAWPFVMVLGWAAALFIVSTLLLPQVEALRVSRKLADALAEVQQKEPEFRVAALGYVEDTLVFYTKQHVEMLGEIPGKGPGRDKRLGEVVADLTEKRGFQTTAAAATTTAPATTTASHPKWALIIEDNLLPELDRRGVVYYRVASVQGFNIAKGKPVSASLITSTRPVILSEPPTSAPVETAPFRLPGM